MNANEALCTELRSDILFNDSLSSSSAIHDINRRVTTKPDLLINWDIVRYARLQPSSRDSATIPILRFLNKTNHTLRKS